MTRIKLLKPPLHGSFRTRIQLTLLIQHRQMFRYERSRGAVVVRNGLDHVYCGCVLAARHEVFGRFVQVEDEEAEDEADECNSTPGFMSGLADIRKR